MTRTCSMANLTKPLSDNHSNNHNPILISGSFDVASLYSRYSTFTTKCSSPIPNSSIKKPHLTPLDPIVPEDMHKFLTHPHKYKFTSFKNYSVVPGRIVNHCQLKKAHCNVGSFFKFQDISIFFCIYVAEIYEDPIHMFYSNLHLSPHSGDLETFVLGTRIILNEFLFEKVLDTKFSRVIPFINDSWPEYFESSSRKQKRLCSTRT